LLQSIIILTVSGEIFYFEDLGFTDEEKENIQNLAQIISKELLNQSITTENEVCKYFIDQVNFRLGISLHEIKVTFVVRINAYTS
jgi:hypothetical protein